MTNPFSFEHHFVDAKTDPFWVTSAFSTKELSVKRVRIEWLRNGEVLSDGIYRFEAGCYGHSRHIQTVRVIRVDGIGCGITTFDLDQTDVDLLHRSNEAPKSYDLVARLDRDRVREQNPHLERLVQERRLRKAKDEAGEEGWKIFAAPVLSPVPVATDVYALSKELERPTKNET